MCPGLGANMVKKSLVLALLASGACGGDSVPEPICLAPAKSHIQAADCVIPRIGPYPCPFPLRDTVYVVDGVDTICCQVEIECPKRPRLGGAP